MHLAHFVQFLALWHVSNCPVVQILTVSIQNISLLCKHRQRNTFSIHWYRSMLIMFCVSRFSSSFLFLNSVP